MQFQVYTSSLLYSHVDVEIRSVDICGNLIPGDGMGFDLYAFEAVTLNPVKFRVEEKLCEESTHLHIGTQGYMKVAIFFDNKAPERDILFRVIGDNNAVFDSKAVRLIKHRINLQEVRLTDDISKYDGEAGIHYTNNDSARIKVLYTVEDEDGLVIDPSDLMRFHSEVQSNFLFANGERIQYADANGRRVDITELDCAVKRKNKADEKVRVHKKVFEERRNEAIYTGASGIVKVSYRLNVFSSHPLLKEFNLDGRRYTIELNHPSATAVSIPPVRILTKYHRVKERRTKETKGINRKFPSHDMSVKMEKQEDTNVNTDNNMRSNIKFHSFLMNSLYHIPTSHTLHSFPFPCPLKQSLKTPVPPIPSTERQQKHQHVTHATCLEAAKKFVDACLSQPTTCGDLHQNKKGGKVFKKVSFKKEPSYFLKKDRSAHFQKPSVIRPKRSKRDCTIGQHVSSFVDNSDSFLRQCEDMLILRSFLPSAPCEPPICSVEVPARTFTDSPPDSDMDLDLEFLEDIFSDSLSPPLIGTGCHSQESNVSAMLDVPEINDLDLEPFLYSQDMFVNFGLFS